MVGQETKKQRKWPKSASQGKRGDPARPDVTQNGDLEGKKQGKWFSRPECMIRSRGEQRSAEGTNTAASRMGARGRELRVQ